jgi:pectin methylesterase-like acyl-CoA thioesterase
MKRPGLSKKHCVLLSLFVITSILPTTAATTNFAMSVVALEPANGATGICYDTPLSITFNQTPVLRNAGKIRIFNITNSAIPVETIDLSLNGTNGTQPRSAFPGDSSAFHYYPVVITGNTAAIYPHAASGLLTSNQTYYVTIDNGTFADSTGIDFAGISASNVWRFTTKAAGPKDPANPIVDSAGTGDFLTVQGAIDSLAPGNNPRRTININDGTYFEIVDIAGKSNVTLRGQSRIGTIVKYPNTAAIAPRGATQARMTLKVNANDVTLENLTITNSTPQGGHQAEALMVNTGARHCIVNGCDLSSRQDTILVNSSSSQAYFYNTRIYGNFDYIWGGGNVYFFKCIVHTITGVTRPNLTAARTSRSTNSTAMTPWLNPNGASYSANGFSFVDCIFDADPGVSNITLAGRNGTPGGLDSWTFCRMDTNAYIKPPDNLTNSYIFWQYQNKDLAGTAPISFGNVTTLTNGRDVRLQMATNVTEWLYGWTPSLELQTSLPTP